MKRRQTMCITIRKTSGSFLDFSFSISMIAVGIISSLSVSSMISPCYYFARDSSIVNPILLPC